MKNQVKPNKTPPKMATTKLLCNRSGPKPPFLSERNDSIRTCSVSFPRHKNLTTMQPRRRAEMRSPVVVVSAAIQPLDLTEENVEKVLLDARAELAQLFDASVGITGQAELAELDGPYVTIRLKGRFWHMRSTVLARLANYLKQRIPEILEVDIEDEKQLDDSPANF